MSIITVIVLLNICFFYFHIEQQAKIETSLSSDKRKHLTLSEKFRHRTNDKSIEINSLELLHNLIFSIDHHFFFFWGGGAICTCVVEKINKKLSISIHTFRCVWLTQDLRNFIVVQFVFKGPEVYLC